MVGWLEGGGRRHLLLLEVEAVELLGAGLHELGEVAEVMHRHAVEGLHLRVNEVLVADVDVRPEHLPRTSSSARTVYGSSTFGTTRLILVGRCRS